MSESEESQLKRMILPALATALLAACTTTGTDAPAIIEAPAVETRTTVAPDVPQRLLQLPYTAIDYDRSLLEENERQVVARLVEASKLIDQIFWLQVSERNHEWYEALRQDAEVSPLHEAGLRYFGIMKGPWDRLAAEEAFIRDAGPKPEGAGYYPPEITEAEIESWIEAHPEDREAFQGLFTVIRRSGDRLVAYPYSQYYRAQLEPAAQLLREAADLTSDPSLADFLRKRAAAFASNDYYESDLAWMDLRGPLEVVIGPYEVYEDELFNYKAAFESFITVVDRPESEKLAIYAQHLNAMERNLPIPDQYKNTDRGSESPIKVVQEIYTAGDARRGVQTAAFNLPNDERVREAKGSKKVLLRNVMEQKFEVAGQPIAERVLARGRVDDVSFDAFFNHVLFHELSHGLGPGFIEAGGERQEVRLVLRDTYSTIEETKADVLGVWNLLYSMDNDLPVGFGRDELFSTYVGIMYRSLRFGLSGAHGRGNAIQWNFLREREAIFPVADGRFDYDAQKLEEGIRELASVLLMVQATGDYDGAKRLLDTYGISNAEMDAVNARLTDLPVDISPVFVGAGESMSVE